jgi:polysaccharide pyruvyl transferase WcaK-like protein
MDQKPEVQGAGQMKPSRICVIGNFSGRNAGDAAILDGLMADIYQLSRNVVFDVPTINPGFVRRQYPGLPVEPRGLLPWNLSVKIFGWPILASITRSDVVLVTDAILFDRKLFNPLYNYLSTLALVLPWARHRGKPVILYNVSLGPVSTRPGIACLQRVLNAANHVVVRDQESLEICARAGIALKGAEEGADCALNVAATRGGDLDRIFDREALCAPGEPFLTVNINSYLDVFLQRARRTGEADFIQLMATTIDRLIEDLKVRVVFTETQPMDLPLANQVFAAVRHPESIRMIDNRTYSHRDLAGVFARAQMHIGMRTHSLILASAMHTPLVGIICTPKNRGYMRSIQQEARMIEFDHFTADNFLGLCKSTWTQRHEIRAELGRIIPREQEKARRTARLLSPYLGETGP